MSENILYKFAQDLSRLYLQTQSKQIESHFVKMAQALDVEVEKWLSKANHQNYKASLSHPEVLDLLIIFAKLKNTYPSGMSMSEMTKFFMSEEKYKHFLITIVALREIVATNDYAILAPYRNLIPATQGMGMGLGSSDTAAIRNDIEMLDNQFREELNQKLNKPLEQDTLTTKQKKVTKREKIILLLNYLSQRFSEEIGTAFEQMGKFDTLGFAENSRALGDPGKLILKMFPSYPPENISIHVNRAKEIVRDISRYVDASDYDYVYNYIKAQLMSSAGHISQKTYDNFMYNSGLNRGKEYLDPGEIHEIESEPFVVHPNAWTVPQTLITLSIILYLLGSKV